MTIKWVIIIATILILVALFCVWFSLWIKARNSEKLLSHVVSKVGV